VSHYASVVLSAAEMIALLILTFIRLSCTAPNRDVVPNSCMESALGSHPSLIVIEGFPDAGPSNIIWTLARKYVPPDSVGRKVHTYISIPGPWRIRAVAIGPGGRGCPGPWILAGKRP
jgi:hypothetical protein